MKWYITTVLCGCILLLSMMPTRENEKAFHSEEEWKNYLRSVHVMPPKDTSHLFPTARECSGCHGHDPQMNAMVDWQGNDVNIHDDWSTSMMANSAKDPFWRAKVSHEVLINPDHKLDLETKCTSCHAPQGHFQSILRGGQHYTIDDMVKDTFGLDGVSCGACHMKDEKDLELLFSGEARYDTSGVMFGPYIMPFAAPMNSFVGFNPVFSEHINSSGICASCHTLFTSSVDLEGNYTGETFAEQATYHEWINSDFDDEGSSPRSCQSCHMPRLEDDIVISANYLFLSPRSPYALHDMVGANIPMIKMIKDHKEVLDIDAADEHFEETIAKTMEMLQKRSIDSELSFEGSTADTATFRLKLENKAGHKFPSGYPSRRVFVEFVVLEDSGDTLFQSGVMDAQYGLPQHDAEYEPHYDVIRTQDQVQIYEYVVGDVNGDVTNVLEQAFEGLKDNRLPPRGFRKNHESYDTVKIIGAAVADENFNVDQEEGSGSDEIEYRIALNGYSGAVNVSAKVYYQALPPRWIKPIFDYQSEEIDLFKDMYENADLEPTIITHDTIADLNVGGLSVEGIPIGQVNVYPNPSKDGIFYLESDFEIIEIQVMDKLGRMIQRLEGKSRFIDLSDHRGLYLVRFETSEGILIKKLIH